MKIVVVLGVVLVPWALIRLHQWKSWLKPIVMAYVVGIVLGNSLPQGDFGDLFHQIMGISIIIAMPLLLFPTQLQQIIRQPKTILLAYVLAVISTTIAVFSGYFLFEPSVPKMELISGMVEGVYTGGTINLNAIGIVYSVSEDLLITLNGFDMALSGVYLLGIFTVFPKLLGKILPESVPDNASETEVLDSVFERISIREKVISVGKGLALSIGILGFSAGLSWVIFHKVDEFILILSVTLLALVVSSFKVVRELPASMPTADYFLMIFGFTLGLQANIMDLFTGKGLLLGYFVFTYLVMLIAHLLLAKLFKIDVHSFLISSTAAVFGPPFIGPVAESIGARNAIAPGIIVALLGNAIGTYLGIVVITLLMG
jgi:uncharacterized membrane protein